MAASAQSGHSIIDQPATAQTCGSDYKAARQDADARKTDSTNAVAAVRSHTGRAPHRR
ncbi:hypothetical protein ACIQV3_22585 [Streptomyces sp. NPDC099050]|uniref:hypothetical protein n=1 Tax=Streptomyces sp. NPDC099050 TaxID=3366100 RepID=UPI0038129C99